MQRSMIPLSTPELRGNEWAYVKECLDTGWVSSVGAFVERFERAMAAHAGSPFAVATVNGTSALHTALMAAGVAPRDEVVVSTLTFIAPANAIRYVGAWPVFIDAEPLYWQMDTEKLAEFLDKSCRWRNGSLYNRTTGRRVRAEIPVHILGHPVDMNPVLDLCRKYGLAVIEDASESLGSLYRGAAPGSFGDAGCFSFNGNKIVTCGGGGMLVTHNQDWAQRARYLTTQAKDDEVEYVHKHIGFNYRLTNLTAALGLAQLEQLASFVEAKRSIAARYEQALAGAPGITPMREAPWARSSYWMYTVLVDAVEAGAGSRDLLRALGSAGVQTRPLWQPLHLSPAHERSFRTDCSVSERLYRDALSLPCSAGLDYDSQTAVIEALQSALGRRARASAAEAI
jgi:perosamine synthetase